VGAGGPVGLGSGGGGGGENGTWLDEKGGNEANGGLGTQDGAEAGEAAKDGGDHGAPAKLNIKGYTEEKGRKDTGLVAGGV